MFNLVKTIIISANIKIEVDEGDLSPIHLDLTRVLEYLETRVAIQSPELYIETYSPGKVNLRSCRLKANQFNSS